MAATPGSHAHGDGEHVVRQQRAGRDETRKYAQVRMRHDVAAAAVRIRPDRLPVAERHDEQQQHDHDRDRHQVVEGVPARAEQDEHAGPACIGHRRHHVRGEDRQRLPLGQPLGQFGGGRERAAEQKTSNRRHAALLGGARSLGFQLGLEDARGPGIGSSGRAGDPLRPGGPPACDRAGSVAQPSAVAPLVTTMSTLPPAWATVGRMRTSALSASRYARHSRPGQDGKPARTTRDARPACTRLTAGLEIVESGLCLGLLQVLARLELLPEAQGHLPGGVCHRS